MEILNFFVQITSTYRRPTPAALLQNNTLFQSVYSPQDAPEVLFHRIEDCQEVQILGENPYTAQQLLNNTVRLLLQCGLYNRDFEDWDRKIASDKIWTNLKTFVHKCYTRCLNATNITAGLQGYVQNAFAALGEESNKDDDNVQTVITQMAALTTQSQLTATTTAETQASVAAAINQLATNQQVMQQQFTAFTTQQNTTYQARTPAPPITQFTIPNVAAFPSEGRGGGQRAGGHGRGGRSNFATTGGRNVRTPFANFTNGQRKLPSIGVSGGRVGGMASFTQKTPAHNMTPMYSNILKRYVNWNV
jgi:hypothetical protein